MATINKYILTTSFVAVCCVQAFAQTEEHSLEEIEVVSHHTFSDIIPVQTLGGERLEKLNALNVADALRYFSGMQVKDYGGVGGIKTVNIRSMGSQHLGIYYDGIELGNAQNGQIDLGQFSLDNVESVSLYNGQKSSLMQTASDYGNAGSVYIRTRVPHFEVGKNNHFRGGIKYGSSNMLRVSALYEHKFSERLNVSLNLGTLTSNGRYDFRYRRYTISGELAYDTTAVRQNGDVQSIRIEGNVNGLLNRGSWSLKGYTYQSGRGIPGAIVNNVWKRGERQTDGNTFFQGTWQEDIGSAYSFRVLAKYANYRTHYANRDTTTMLVDNHYTQQEAYVSTTHCVQFFKWLSASMAYDMRCSGLTSDAYACPEPQRWTHLISLATAVSLHRFSAQASILYNNTRDKGRASATGVTPVGVMSDISRFTPALFLNYYITRDKSLSVRGYMKNSFRMPTFNDLYYAEMGNSNLTPEKASQYDLGIRYTIARKQWTLTATADAYYNNVKDKIIAYPKGQQFRWTMLNLGVVHITGVDAETDVTYETLPIYGNPLKCSLRLQYTFQKSIDVTDNQDSYYRHQIPYTPRHSGSVIFNADWKHFSFNYSFIYTGERYSLQDNIAVNHLEPWYTSDMSLSYSMGVARTQLRLTLEVNNIFAQDYDVILNYPMPQRTYAISLDVRL